MSQNTKPSAQEIQGAKDVLKKAGYLMIFWHEDDIRGYELEDGYNDEGEIIPPLTDDEVDDIATSLENNWDAAYGVSWDTIGFEVFSALEARKDY